MNAAARPWPERLQDSARHGWILVQEAFGGFRRNDDLRQASSLAFSAMLALIPAMLLLTYLLGMTIGSNRVAMQKVTDLVGELIPEYGEVILREVARIAHHRHSAGLFNLLALLWAVTPLVANTRAILNGIFRVVPRRSFWITKSLDFLMAMVFVTGLAAVASLGVLLRYLKLLRIDLTLPAGLRFTVPFLLTVLLLVLMYRVFAPRTKVLHLVAGALTTTLLWFLLRPLFSLFLTYNPGYGVAFGSFKSLFVVVIWIYYSQAVFLFGAEVAAALRHQETLLIRRLMEGKHGVSLLGRRHLLTQVPAGTVFFREGEWTAEMYHLLKGSASVQRGGHELAVLGAGAFFGEMSLLLGQPRSATVVAREACECLVIHEENLDALMREFPDILRGMLTEMARRLREADASVTGPMVREQP